jgi:aspartyl-tRNA(Asn)/glutamyl-tRNA(Gln) amidotransferase subunit A
VIPLSDSLDHAGPITRSVRDAALMLQVIAGHDPNDSTSSREAVPDYTAALERDAKGIRVGIIKQLAAGTSDEVAHSFNAAVREFKVIGVEVDEVSIPTIAMASTIATNIMWAEAYEYHEKWMRTRPDDYGLDVRRMLEAGMHTPAVNYVRSQRARARLLAEVLNALDKFDVLIAPTAGIEAPRIDVGGRALMPNGHPVNMVTEVLRFTAPFNVTGLPALTLPTRLSPDGLPLSMQIIGRPFDESTVFRAAAAYEQARGPIPAPKLA